MTLNRPEVRNAQTPDMWQTLATLARSVPTDVRFVVLTGAGVDFSAGLDRAVLADSGPEGMIARLQADASGFIEAAQEGFRAWSQIPQTVIAVVQGNVIGAGFQLALASDVIIAEPGARFALRETSIGLVPDLGGTGALIDALGYRRTFALCATGDFLSAAEAANAGLVHAVEEDVVAALTRLCDQLRGVDAGARCRSQATAPPSCIGSGLLASRAQYATWSAAGIVRAGPSVSMQTVWQTYQSMTRDRSVQNRKIARSTVRRIFGYARPYRVIVAIFLLTLVVTSLLSVAQPLLFRRIVDDGISVGNASLVTWTAVAIAGLAIADAALGLVSRWFSARIGEGLIYDLRTQVYDHVQRQSIGFFTRTQTGALISRLNSDVIGAQQAFTSTLGGVLGNLISVTIVLITMFALSWQITLVSLILVPLFLLPARFMGRRLQALTREQMTLNAEMSSQMTERFNVSGAHVGKTLRASRR